MRVVEADGSVHRWLFVGRSYPCPNLIALIVAFCSFYYQTADPLLKNRLLFTEFDRIFLVQRLVNSNTTPFIALIFSPGEMERKIQYIWCTGGVQIFRWTQTVFLQYLFMDCIDGSGTEKVQILPLKMVVPGFSWHQGTIVGSSGCRLFHDNQN